MPCFWRIGWVCARKVFKWWSRFRNGIIIAVLPIGSHSSDLYELNCWKFQSTVKSMRFHLKYPPWDRWGLFARVSANEGASDGIGSKTEMLSSAVGTQRLKFVWGTWRLNFKSGNLSFCSRGLTKRSLYIKKLKILNLK